MKRDMYLMKSFRHFCHMCRLLLLMVILLPVISCTEQTDEPADAGDGRTATISLIIPRPDVVARTTSSVNPTDPDYEAQLTAEERTIYTLRIVIYSLHANNNATTINRLYTAEELNTVPTNTEGNWELDITGVPAGPAQICVVANEASIGQDYSDILTMQQQTVDVETTGSDGTITTVSKVLLEDPANAYFPKRGTELLAETTRKGLPMSWMVKNREIVADGANVLNVELEHCVSKLRMKITNSFSAAIQVKEISFGQFFGDRFYLFKETDLDVPGDAIYRTKTYTDDVDYPIANGKSLLLICYLYPSFAWNNSTIASPYTIGFQTEKGKYPLMAFLHEDSGERYNSIPRNKQVNIDVTLSGASNVSVDFEVVDWTPVNIEVPSFD